MVLGDRVLDILLPVIVAISALIGIDGFDVLLFLLSIAFVIISTKVPEQVYTSTKDLSAGDEDSSHNGEHTAHMQQRGRMAEGEERRSNQQEQGEAHREEGEEEEEQEAEEGEEEARFHGYHFHHEAAHEERNGLRRDTEDITTTTAAATAASVPRPVQTQRRQQASKDDSELSRKQALRASLRLRRRLCYFVVLVSPLLQFCGVYLLRRVRAQNGFLMGLVDPSLFLVLSVIRLLLNIGRLHVESNEAIQVKLQESRHKDAALEVKVMRLVEDAETSATEVRRLRMELNALKRSVESSFGIVSRVHGEGQEVESYVREMDERLQGLEARIAQSLVAPSRMDWRALFMIESPPAKLRRLSWMLLGLSPPPQLTLSGRRD